jgi:hypothetical protein
VNDRVRHTATGAIAALAAAGAIAGGAALAAGPGDKTPSSPPPQKTPAQGPAPDYRPFLNAVQQLVDQGTITAAQAEAVDREIQSGRIDTGTLASSGFTPAQLEAVQEALANAKRALAAAAGGGTP